MSGGGSEVAFDLPGLAFGDHEGHTQVWRSPQQATVRAWFAVPKHSLDSADTNAYVAGH